MPIDKFMRPLSRLLGRDAAEEPAATPPADVTPADAAGESLEAVRQLQNVPALRRLAGLDAAAPADAPLERAARTRLAQLVDAGDLDFTTLQGGAGDPAALLSIAEACHDPAHLAATFAAIRDPQIIAQLVTSGTSSRIRQLAANAIDDPAELKRLLSLIRGRDKEAYKIIRKKCDALLATERRIAEIEAGSAAICASLQRLSRKHHDAAFEPSLRILEAEWRAFDAIAPETTREQARQAIASCREIIAAHPQTVDLSLLGKSLPNPWQEKLPDAHELKIAAAKNLTYSTRVLRAHAGDNIGLTFVNPDVVPHNWVLVKPNSLSRVGTLANKLIADPDAVLHQYVPDLVARASVPLHRA